MQLNELRERTGARKARKRRGRGGGSGIGGTSGSGHKGQKSRSGVSLLGFEGGQMPLYRRLPKRGFNNPFSKDYAELTIGNLERAAAKGIIDAKKPVTEDVLRECGLVKKSRNGVRLLATGELKTKFKIEVTGATKGAIAAVEKAGGSITVTPPPPRIEGKKGRARHRKFRDDYEGKPKKKAESDGADQAEDKADKKASEKGAEDKAPKSKEENSGSGNGDAAAPADKGES